MQHVEESAAARNFTFKCHRETSDIFSVNAISFHPQVCVGGCGVVWCGVVWCGVVWCGVAAAVGASGHRLGRRRRRAWRQLGAAALPLPSP